MLSVQLWRRALDLQPAFGPRRGALANLGLASSATHLLGCWALTAFSSRAQDYRSAQVACTMPTLPPFLIRPRPPPLFAPSPIFRLAFFPLRAFLRVCSFGAPLRPLPSTNY